MTAPARDPIASEARRAKRERLLGDSPACVRCGLAEIDSLIAVKRGVLEAHHVVGRANDEDLTVALCRNCHAVVTERYRDAGVSLNRPPTVLHQLSAILRAQSALLIDLGHRGVLLADALCQLIALLDREFPSWRAIARVVTWRAR